jgi:hypothetical protein
MIKLDRWFWFMLFNATFNNISVISWRSVLLMEKTGSTWRKIRVLQTDTHLVFYVRIFVINNQTHTPIKRELINNHDHDHDACTKQH